MSKTNGEVTEDAVITTDPFPASRKVHVSGAQDVRVAMREISHGSTGGNGHGGNGANGNAGEGARLRVYDTSGPYTDPDAAIDIARGLEACCGLDWIEERAATRSRLADPTDAADNGNGDSATEHLSFEFPSKQPRCGPRPGGNGYASCMYARKGIITPEMEYIAIRENFAPSWTRSAVRRIPTCASSTPATASVPRVPA